MVLLAFLEISDAASGSQGEHGRFRLKEDSLVVCSMSDGWKDPEKKVMELELKLHSPVGGESITYTWPVSGSVSIRVCVVM